MPDLERQVTRKLADVEDELAELPEPPQNALQVVNQAVTSFTQDFKAKILASEPNDLSEAWKKISNEFYNTIAGQNGLRPTINLVDPDFVSQNGGQYARQFKVLQLTYGTIEWGSSPQPPKTYTSMKASKRTSEVINLSSDEEEMVHTPCRKRVAHAIKREGRPHMLESYEFMLISKTIGGVPSIVKPPRDREYTFHLPSFSITWVSNLTLNCRLSIANSCQSALRKVFSLGEIRSTLESFSTSGLPSAIELKAVDHMMLSTLKNWNKPVDVLFKSLRAALARSLAKSLRDTVGQWRATKLYEKMHSASLDFLNEHLTSMQVHVNRSLLLERAKPITRDEQLMNRYISEEEAELTVWRLKNRLKMYNSRLAENGGKELSFAVWDDKTCKNVSTLLGPDTYASEITVMARIRAYYHIASTRFVDHVAQSVEAELLMKFRSDLDHDLNIVLKVFDQDGRFCPLHGPDTAEN
jgi:hypothetical protein